MNKNSAFEPVIETVTGISGFTGPNRSKKMTSKIRRPFGMAVLFASSFIFFSQVFFPSFTAQAEIKSLSPVSDKFLEELALRRIEIFSFDELTFGSDTREDLGLEPGEEIPQVFYLTIPKLGIEKMKVETNSVDTTPHEMLGHYKGSSLPGKPGNTFIYAHSTLPSRYDPNNYKTLGTRFPDLEDGDILYLDYNDKRFKYVVDKSEVLEPEDVDPLARRNLHYSSVSLMTCVPPGTIDDRMIVFAKKAF